MKPLITKKHPSRLLAAVATSLCAEAPPLFAAESEEITTPRVDVIGTIENLPHVSGTATIVGPEELETSRVFTTSEALRRHRA